MGDESGGLYIALLSVHGLIRGQNLELGRDADTGGQTLYVLQLAKALAKQPGVAQVDLVTRRIVDETVSEDYAKPIEPLSERLRIVRILAGPDEYIHKEQLWDHLDTFADNLIDYFRTQGAWPDLLHSHYADAGYVGEHLANQLGIPLVHTGHSLGKVKRARLLASGLSADEIETRYNMARRIEAEEITLAAAEKVVTSTHHEITEQYELYDHYQPERMRVIPPGTNLDLFKPPEGRELTTALYLELTRHLKLPEKPIILALSRPDKRKNITTLIEAYGSSPALQEQANLVVIAGNRDDVEELEEGAQEVFHELWATIDRYDLYGRVALPKHHQRHEVPYIYRIAAASGGVFVNPALTEPFGLTLIEAAASGLPIVATEDGGPQDIIRNCQNGLLINPLDPGSISEALKTLLDDPEYRKNCIRHGLEGVATHYAWEAHAQRYLQMVRPIAERCEPLAHQPLVRREQLCRDRGVVTSLDQNLAGDHDALQALMNLIRQNRSTTLFMVATGRRLDSALKLLKKYGMPEPDILMASGGTEIYYAPQLTADIAWAKHIAYQWTPHLVRDVLDQIPGLELQPKSEQSRFKVSYFMDPELADVESIKRLLHQKEQNVHVQLSFGQYLDILPVRASKGMALRYVADCWEIPLEHIFVAGGSGADEDMMRGNTLAAVVRNRHDEALSQLVETERIYFAEKPYEAGILEALSFYDFFGRCCDPREHESGSEGVNQCE